MIRKLVRRLLVLIAVGLSVMLFTLFVNPFEDRSPPDMPWLGSGMRARLYYRESSCLMCPTGYQSEERWGRFSWSGEAPYNTVSKAMSFLSNAPLFANAPSAKGAGSIADDSGIITPRALPYHFTIVMLEPTVVVMNFDLGAIIHAGEAQQGQVVGTPYIDGYLSYGTKVPATGTLLWFSPEDRAGPKIVSGQKTGFGDIRLTNGIKLALELRGDDWLITVIE